MVRKCHLNTYVPTNNVLSLAAVKIIKGNDIQGTQNSFVLLLNSFDIALKICYYTLCLT